MARPKGQQAKSKTTSKVSTPSQKPTTNEPDIPSLAEYIELHKNTTAKDQYTITLPYDTKQHSSWLVAAKAVQRTRKRWEWFAQG
ncbi:hypothetical protein OEA41_009802 [Lepraria neglecta]|uniref:Uncharacterized protein n=1 Tax=Lepraria neglecta TaxID=209136 RepID=A0AAE0DD83_9LECA|nr:hypothetical protein OEA41_009802 [Lepraria neglecta]